MAYPHTFPTLFDEVLTLDIKSYKAKGCLQPYQQSTGVTSWRSNGNVTAKIGFAIRIIETSGILELDYTFNQKPIKYSVPIVSKKSNLGIGRIWFFICPITKKYCRKLYLISGYFLHREAFKGCMYECQTKSKDSRRVGKLMKMIFAKNDFMEGRKHLKTHYRGKLTKTYLRYLELEEMERQMLGTGNILSF